MIQSDLISWTLLNGMIANLDLKESFWIKIAIGLYAIYTMIPRYYRYQLFEKLIKKVYKQRNSITVTYNDDLDTVSDKFVSISEYINSNCKNIRSCKELCMYEWDNNDNRKKTSFYQVDQHEPFIISEKLDLWGEYSFIERNEGGRKGGAGATYIKTITKISIFSYRLSSKEISEWIEEVSVKRVEKINARFNRHQYIIKIGYDTDQNNISIATNKFKSNATFDNSYAPFQQKVKDSLDFFLENEDYYEEKGIPYTFGIAAVGIPGGGKTRLLKQLLNYTGRHAVVVELSNEFNLDVLDDIMHGNISTEIQFKPSDFIVIFEDFDTFTDMVKSRIEEIKQDIKEKDGADGADGGDKKKIKETEKRVSEAVQKQEKSDRRGLGKLLNTLDGVNERDGAIIFATTNFPDGIDKAFMRPGRFDYKNRSIHQRTST